MMMLVIMMNGTAAIDDDKGKYLVVQPEDVVVNADVIKLDEGLNVPKNPKHFSRLVCTVLICKVNIARITDAVQCLSQLRGHYEC